MEEQKKSAASVEKEGEKVTGGADAGNSSGTTTSKESGEEFIPDDATKKEKLTGYNELPEQEKVGGD